jgi:hypothetical protein
MRRILAFAACGLSLGACTSADLFRFEDRTPVTLRLESQPPGADATVSGGGTCKTPCSLPVSSFGEVSVSYSLEGYEPQEAAVAIVQPTDPREGPVRANPNPVYVELEALPGAPRRPAARRPAPKKPAAARPAAKKPAAKKPAAKKPAAKPAATRSPPPPAPAPAAAAPAPDAPAPATTQSSPWGPAPGQPPAKQ